MAAPPAKSLLPQQFFWDNSAPSGKIWAGVPVSVDASGYQLVTDLSVPGPGPFLPLAGGALSGFLTLNADPTAALHAATKQYVDAKVAAGGPYLPLSGGVLTGALQVPNGTLAAPSLALGGAANGMYYSGGVRFVLAGAQKLQIANQIIGAVPFLAPAGTQAAPGLCVSNELTTGFFWKAASSASFAVSNAEVMNWQAAGVTAYTPITLPADPTLALQAATKHYVDNLIGAMGGPSLAINFMTPGTLDPRITFTRASTATYTDASGTIQTAATNAPLWDYDPVTHALRGLLIEKEARTNILFPSTNWNNIHR